MLNKKRKKKTTMSALALAVMTAVTPIDTPVYAQEELMKISNDNIDDWTVGIYMSASNLETEGHQISRDLIEILSAKVPEEFSEKVNIIIETGGAKAWHFKKEYSKVLAKKGLSQTEINQIIPANIDGSKIQQYRVDFNHKYVDDEGNEKTAPALVFLKDVAEYPKDVEITKEYLNNPDVVSMGNSKYLEEFINDLNEDYPAKKRMLSFSSHGRGVAEGICYDEQLEEKDYLDLRELVSALDNAKSEEFGKFEVIGMDACFMSSYEVYNHLNDYADIAIAALTDEPGYGWYYTPVFEDLGENYGDDEYTGKELSKTVIDAFKEFYKKDGICDQMIYAGLLEDEGENAFSDAALCAIDLAKLNESIPMFNGLSENLMKLYTEKGGSDYIKEKMQDAGLMYNYNMVGMDKFLDIIIENADKRIKELEGSEEGFDAYSLGLYKQEKEQAEELKSQIRKCN